MPTGCFYSYDHARAMKERNRRLQIAHRKAAERGLTPSSVLFDAAVQSILRKKFGR